MARMYQPQLGAQIQQGISNLGDLFAPPSAQDAYLSAKLKADQAAAAQKAAALAAVKGGSASPADYATAGISSDIQKAANIADMFARAKADPRLSPAALDASVYATGLDAGKTFAGESMKPIAENATRAPASTIADALGIPRVQPGVVQTPQGGTTTLPAGAPAGAMVRGQAPQRPATPTIPEANQQREAEAGRLGLQGEDRLQYITSGKIPTQGEKQTGEQANAATFATRMREAEKILADPKIASAGLGVKGGLQDVAASIPFVGNAMLSPEYQQLDQAKRDFVNAVLRKESGAAISQGEFDNAEKQYFPRPGDSPQVIAQKAHNRRTAMETIANAGGLAFRKQFFGGQQPTQSPGPQTSQNPGPAASAAGPDIANMPIEQLSTLDPAKLTTEQLQAVVARRRALTTAQQAQ